MPQESTIITILKGILGTFLWAKSNSIARAFQTLRAAWCKANTDVKDFRSEYSLDAFREWAHNQLDAYCNRIESAIEPQSAFTIRKDDCSAFGFKGQLQAGEFAEELLSVVSKNLVAKQSKHYIEAMGGVERAAINMAARSTANEIEQDESIVAAA